MKPEKSLNTKEIKDIHDFSGMFDDDRIFILGNGPSLKNTDLEKIKDEYSMGINSINKIYSQTTWRPNFFVCGKSVELSQERISNYSQTINKGIITFMPDDKKKTFDRFQNIYYYSQKCINNSDEVIKKMINDNDYGKAWDNDISTVYYGSDGATSIYQAFQIAVSMGFNKIYFLGCDLNYQIYKPYMIFDSGTDPFEYIKENSLDNKNKLLKLYNIMMHCNKPLPTLANTLMYKLLYNNYINTGEIISGLNNVGINAGSNNHFDSTYYASPIIDEDINNKLINVHKLISMVAKDLGIEVYNATKGGKLEVHERVDLDQIVQ